MKFKGGKYFNKKFKISSPWNNYLTNSNQIYFEHIFCTWIFFSLYFETVFFLNNQSDVFPLKKTLDYTNGDIELWFQFCHEIFLLFSSLMLTLCWFLPFFEVCSLSLSFFLSLYINLTFPINLRYCSLSCFCYFSFSLSL